jgi:hypothetical protein
VENVKGDQDEKISITTITAGIRAKRIRDGQEPIQITFTCIQHKDVNLKKTQEKVWTKLRTNSSFNRFVECGAAKRFRQTRQWDAHMN